MNMPVLVDWLTTTTGSWPSGSRAVAVRAHGRPARSLCGPSAVDGHAEMLVSGDPFTGSDRAGQGTMGTEVEASA